MEKTGLVLEGGGMRGIYTAGVLDTFLDYGVKADGVIGVSAGAVHGCSFVSGQRGRSIRYTLKYCHDPRYMSIRSLVKTGDLFGADFCYRQLPEELDPFDNEAFCQSSTKFYVTCTDVETGSPVYHLCPDLGRQQVRWMQASASMPLAARIVEQDGRKLLDGGIADSIPVKAFRKRGYTRCVVVLTRPEGYVKKASKTGGLIRCAYRQYPRLVQAMERRHLKYNRQLEEIRELEQAGEICVIRPSRLLEVSRTERDLKKIQAMYDLGREDATEKIQAVLTFLNQKETLPEEREISPDFSDICGRLR